MGNSSSSSREHHHTARSHPISVRHVTSAATPGTSSPHPPSDRHIYSSRSGRGSRHDLSFLHIGSRDRDSEREPQPEPRRETKQEREARKLERERIAREKERERSVREENVDGGFLVTLGTYTGPEDFSKPAVRQLMIERRLAPFWKGLDDHNRSWTENQLVAAVRGLPIPAPDAVPLEIEQRPSDTKVSSLTVPIGGRSQSYQSDRSGAPSPSRPSSSYPNNSSSATNLFRGRAKTLASLGTSKHLSSSPAPQEVQLPRDPYVNGSPIEVHLYKDAAECPICFLYYPPHLNRTRCCDQPICSECFVQIKRPDPHAPEHHDDPANPTPPPPPEEEGLLVSEPSACPFCVTPEFGVTYEPPQFRRGLIYSGPASRNPVASPDPAMVSSTSLQAPTQGRRRTTSLSASASQVITTDRVRPDWAKKLADARAHALRRSAAATALHNAAYMLGNNQASDSRGLVSRRRRTIFGTGGESTPANGSGTPARLPDTHPLSHLSSLILQNDRQGSDSDAPAGRTASRRSRVQDLEDLMMMEAIRMSLASEEERRKKDEKNAKKDSKKREKEAKKAEKSAKKTGALYSADMNASTATWTSMTRSSSNLPQASTSPPPAPPSSGKGKAPVSANTSSGFNPLSEPTSTLNQSSGPPDITASTSSSHIEDPQRHLETQRANLQQPQLVPTAQSSQPIALPADHRAHLRHLSNASSIASSLGDSAPSSYHRPSDLGQSSNNASGTNLDVETTETPPDHSQSETPGNGGAGPEPMFNFRSLAAMIGEEEKARDADHLEFAENLTPERQSQRTASAASSLLKADTTRSRGDSGESSSSAAASVQQAYSENSAAEHGVRATQ